MSKIDERHFNLDQSKSLEKKDEIFLDKILDRVKSNETKDFYEFSGFRLDLNKKRLLKNDEIILLTPKEFEVLRTLVTHAGKVVEKDELLDKIWADTFVEETTLARNVSWLRKKLGTGGEKLIETVPKLGYRFVPEVHLIQNARAIVVEEQITQTITVNETATVSDHRQLLPTPKVNYFWPGLGLFAFSIAVMLVLAYFIFWNKMINRPVNLSGITAFSNLPGLETMPAFSPDGTKLAYVWDNEEKKMDIYVRNIGSMDPLRLTRNAENDIYPVFSPDGEHIAFLRSLRENSEIYLIPAAGGAERKICSITSINSSISFAPDGKTLAVVDSEADRHRLGIFLVDLETGEKKRLTTPPAWQTDDSPNFSPDGNTVIFTRGFSQNEMELFSVSASGGEPKQLTNDKVAISGATFDADGKNIFFGSKRDSNQFYLWQMPAGGGEPQLINRGRKNITNPTISKDGKTIAFVESLSNLNIWEVGLPEQKTTEKVLFNSPNSDNSPSFSPDGKKIVFISDMTGNFEVWLADADGKNQKQLTFGRHSAGSPRFSPDGKFIAYGLKTGNITNVFILPADGSEAPRNLTPGETKAMIPAWSADGKFIYFTSDKSGQDQLWKIPAVGGEAVQITRDGAFESFAAPDGKMIFFTKMKREAGIWKVNIDGTEEAPVTGLEDAGYWRYWTVTPTGIYYVSRAANPPFKIRFYDFKTLTAKDLAETFQIPGPIYSGFSVSPADYRIVFVQFDQYKSSIMLAKFGE
jgi:Tol biopolymer transport system component/DNA-binding winged helix-turn-helix (wHTH) protein